MKVFISKDSQFINQGTNKQTFCSSFGVPGAEGNVLFMLEFIAKQNMGVEYMTSEYSFIDGIILSFNAFLWVLGITRTPSNPTSLSELCSSDAKYTELQMAHFQWYENELARRVENSFIKPYATYLLGHSKEDNYFDNMINGLSMYLKGQNLNDDHLDL